MREIKFRAWDECQMRYSDSWKDETCSSLLSDEDDLYTISDEVYVKPLYVSKKKITVSKFKITRANPKVYFD